MTLLALLAGVVVAVLYVSHRRDRLVAAAVGMIFVLAALWVADLVAISRDWRDADGFVDCNDVCTTEQEAAGVILIGVPILLFLLMGILVFARLGRAREDDQPRSR